MKSCDQSAAGNGAIAAVCEIGRSSRAVPDQRRWAIDPKR